MRGEPGERKHSMQGSLAVGGASGSRLFEGGSQRPVLLEWGAAEGKVRSKSCTPECVSCHRMTLAFTGKASPKDGRRDQKRA